MAVALVALALQVAAVACISKQCLEESLGDGDHARIFGGQLSGPHEFPTQAYIMAAFYNTGRRSQYGMFCGGTIISETWILTAAHCVKNAIRTSVGIGSTVRDELKYVTGRRMIAHEDYGLYGRHNNNAVNDIGLVQLWEPLVLDGYTTALAELALHERIHSNEGVLVIGWGRWSYNRTLPIINSCGILKKVKVNVFPCPDHRRDVFCIRSEAGQGICDGDSGGPLLVDGVAFGVASYVDNINPDPQLNPNDYCNADGTWAVYTSIPHYREWIRSITGI